MVGSLRPDVNKAEVVLIDLGVSANLKITPVLEDVSWLLSKKKGSQESRIEYTIGTHNPHFSGL